MISAVWSLSLAISGDLNGALKLNNCLSTDWFCQVGICFLLSVVVL